MTAQPAKKRSKPPAPFRVKSETEIAIANRCDGKECPPKSAKLVADLDMGSNPGAGDLRIYSISPNRDRSAWVLWLRREDEDGGPLYYPIAVGRPYHGYQAKFAAERLLTKCWQLERNDLAERSLGPPEDALAMKPGLLTQQDILRIILAVYGEKALREAEFSNLPRRLTSRTSSKP